MERILCAAIHINDGIDYGMLSQDSVLGDGYVIGGHSHLEIRKVVSILRLQGRANEGFLTNHDRFVSRETAGKIAFASGQIQKPVFELTSNLIH